MRAALLLAPAAAATGYLWGAHRDGALKVALHALLGHSVMFRMHLRGDYQVIATNPRGTLLSKSYLDSRPVDLRDPEPWKPDLGPVIEEMAAMSTEEGREAQQALMALAASLRGAP